MKSDLPPVKPVKLTRGVAETAAEIARDYGDCNFGCNEAIAEAILAAVAPPRPQDEVEIKMTREEAFYLIQGAIKGNVVYGAAAGKPGQMTIKLAERFCAEFDFKLN